MAKYFVVDQDNFEPGIGMTLDQEDMVEREGYRDVETIVREFAMAGQRLDDYRREEFDRAGDDVALDLPLNRRQGFDMAEASMILEAEAKRIKAVQDGSAGLSEHGVAGGSGNPEPVKPAAAMEKGGLGGSEEGSRSEGGGVEPGIGGGSGSK